MITSFNCTIGGKIIWSGRQRNLCLCMCWVLCQETCTQYSFFCVCSKDTSVLFPQTHGSPPSLLSPLHLYKCILKYISTVNKQQTFTEHLECVPGIGQWEYRSSVQPTGLALTHENQHTGTALGLATLWLLPVLLNGWMEGNRVPGNSFKILRCAPANCVWD